MGTGSAGCYARVLRGLGGLSVEPSGCPGASVKAVILCGGQGTRIRDANELLPKPMLPIGGKPIVWHIMKGYAVHGVREFVLCLGYKGWLIKEFFLNYRTMMTDVTVTLGRHDSVLVHDRHDEEEWKVTLAETGETAADGRAHRRDPPARRGREGVLRHLRRRALRPRHHEAARLPREPRAHRDGDGGRTRRAASA